MSETWRGRELEAGGPLSGGALGAEICRMRKGRTEEGFPRQRAQLVQRPGHRGEIGVRP